MTICFVLIDSSTIHFTFLCNWNALITSPVKSQLNKNSHFFIIDHWKKKNIRHKNDHKVSFDSFRVTIIEARRFETNEGRYLTDLNDLLWNDSIPRQSKMSLFLCPCLADYNFQLNAIFILPFSDTYNLQAPHCNTFSMRKHSKTNWFKLVC